MYRSILVPVDFSAVSVQAVKLAGDLSRALGGQLTVLHVLEGAALEGEARAQLEELTRQHRRPPKLLVVQAEPGGVADVILQRARECGAELLVLGASGCGGSEELGRVARDVAFRASVPVHVVPAALQHARGVPTSWRSLVQSA